jgi:predicted anti-sigma-YlaC factor YlaD
VIEPQIRCVELVELVTEWMEGALDDQTRAYVEEHLVICPPCSTYVTQIRQAVKAMQGLDVEAPLPAAREELLGHFRARRRA